VSFQKKNEKKSRTIVSWFRFPFRFLFRWLFRVFSFRVRAVTATTCKLTTTRTILVSIPVPCLQPIILIKTKKNGQRVQRFHTRKRIPPRKKTIIVKASCWPCPILQIQYNTPHYISKDKKDRPSSSTTGWRRVLGCLICVCVRHFPPKSTIFSGSFAKINLRLKAS